MLRCRAHRRYRSSRRRLRMHPSREIALMRAILEAAQVRTTYIIGSREDIEPADYDPAALRARNAEMRAFMRQSEGSRDFRSVASARLETFEAEVAWLLDRLRSIGLGQAIAVDLTRPEIGIPVVRMIVPGLQNGRRKRSAFPVRPARSGQGRPTTGCASSSRSTSAILMASTRARSARRSSICRRSADRSIVRSARTTRGISIASRKERPNLRRRTCSARVRFVLDIWERYFGRRIEWHFARDYREARNRRLPRVCLERWGDGAIAPYALNFDVDGARARPPHHLFDHRLADALRAREANTTGFTSRPPTRRR